MASNLISESMKAVVRRFTAVLRSRAEVRRPPNVHEYLCCEQTGFRNGKGSRCYDHFDAEMAAAMEAAILS
jgi:hypothetical protein